MQQQTTTAGSIDAVSVVCIALIAMGWFGMNALVVSIGGFNHGTPFIEMLAAMRQPALLLTGVGAGHGLETALFALLCALILGLGLLPWRSRQPIAHLTAVLPLALMLICALQLYGGSSSVYADVSPNSLSGNLIHWTNQTLHRTQSGIASHISLGAGAYLSLAASILLAWRGFSQFMRRRATLQGPPLTRPDGQNMQP